MCARAYVQVVAALAQHFRFELVSPMVHSENYLTFKPRDALIRVYLQSPPACYI